MLPKSGPRFDIIVMRLKAVGLPQLSAKYMQLRDQVIEHFLMELTEPATLGPVLRGEEALLYSATETALSLATDAVLARAIETDTSSATAPAGDDYDVDLHEGGYWGSLFPDLRNVA